MKQTELIKALENAFDSVKIEAADTYYWSPQDVTVYYQSGDNTEVGVWALLHETSHGLLEHKSYRSDFELVMLEVAAWDKAKELAAQFSIDIDEDHIQDCLDSYRDWQYKRSVCPHCDLGGVQTDARTYQCIFCDDTWTVTAERFCRPYRLMRKPR